MPKHLFAAIALQAILLVACGDGIAPLPVERFELETVGGVALPAPIVPASVGGNGQAASLC